MSVRNPRRPTWLSALALAALAGAAWAATPSSRARGPAGLPDSVLARIDANRQITVREFRNAWSGVRPPTRPDSLTPETAREFLNLLVDKELLGARAIREALPWSQRESLSFQAFRDQVTLKDRLDSLLAGESRARVAAGQPAGNPQELGVAVRETTMLRIHARFDELLASRLALRWAAIPKPNSDSSMMAQIRMMGEMPRVEAADTAKVIAWSDEGNVRTSQLLDSWRQTDPFARPRVEKSDQIRDLAKNVLFERWLRRTATDMKLDRRPDLARQVERRREYQSVNRLVARDVDGRLKTDSTTMRAWYEKNVDEYRLPDIVDLTELVLPTRASASTMYGLLYDPVKAESLLVQGRRTGADYHVQVTLESDSVTFRAAQRLGRGAMLGPDSTARGWRVARITGLQPARRRTFAEARQLVEHHYREVEGERLMRDLLVRLRKESPVTLNSKALSTLAGQ